MKSGKLTYAPDAPARRWYDDACGAAHAMELLGERWSLLVVRELMFGPRRFGELRAGLPGISATVLTQRLAGLEAAGILGRRQLPSPASVQVYELTPWGYEVEPVFQALGRWAVKSTGHDPTLFLSAASFMLSMRTMVVPARLADWNATVGFRIGADNFVARVDEREIAIRRAEPDAVDLLFDADTTTLIQLFYGKRSMADAEVEGRLRLTGERALAPRFADLFTLPV